MGPLFPEPVNRWSVHQERLVDWLRYYDNFYEMVKSQHYISDVEVVEAWMAEYDIIVDAFYTWYDYMSRKKRDENQGWRDSNIPGAGQHGNIAKAAYQ